ncbi:hypothetical protein M0P65_06175 [Candidatus Gracilibacteria bacterium]|jgi:hypothetical protein|nr:hypothetical protein [Candidatus Gracilibacteria bacterium]
MSSDQKKIIDHGVIYDVLPMTIRGAIFEDEKIIKQVFERIKKMAADSKHNIAHKDAVDFAKKQMSLKPKIVKVTLNF